MTHIILRSQINVIGLIRVLLWFFYLWNFYLWTSKCLSASSWQAPGIIHLWFASHVGSSHLHTKTWSSLSTPKAFAQLNHVALFSPKRGAPWILPKILHSWIMWHCSLRDVGQAVQHIKATQFTSLHSLTWLIISRLSGLESIFWELFIFWQDHHIDAKSQKLCQSKCRSICMYQDLVLETALLLFIPISWLHYHPRESTFVPYLCASARYSLANI